MASATELDIFARSLGGDRRARIDLYRKYLRDNSRVCRLGSGYADLNEFLHDCFTNLLRTGQSWDKEIGLSQWVETVAAWTALLNERRHDLSARGNKGAIRMCAEVEGEDITRREVLSAYAPPLLGPDDSPSSRLLALLTDAEKAVFSKRAIERGTWEEAAAAAGKPLSVTGSIFARTLARLGRFFGAPPPMDEDLIPVFARAAADPHKPEGRAVSLQLDAIFYTITPELQKIGLSTAYDARTVVLWIIAVSGTPPPEELRKHLDQCHYCTDLLRAMILLQQALLSAPGVEFHLCPGAFTLSHAPDMVSEALQKHLAQCSICSAERTQVLEGQAPRLTPEGETRDVPAGAGKKIAWVAAAVILLAVVSFAGYRFVASREEVNGKPSVLTSENLTPTVSPDVRYRKLVQNVPLDDARIMASVLPQNRMAARSAIGQFSLGQWATALSISSQVAEKSKDPGMQMLYAMCLYQSRLMTDAYREMLKSESMSPRDSFRCWIMFQFSLMVNDRKIIDREAEHLSADPEYKERVETVMEQLKTIG
jgi:DNA-directed RNA polymerase specialized sigma24 family protein